MYGGRPEREVCFQFHGKFGSLFSVSIQAMPAAPRSREATVDGIHVEQGQGSPGSQ